MKKSKVETAETRRRIISTASKLFMERGLGETGIAEVMVAAGLTQGGFYRHFESKEQLIAEANREANEELFRFYDEAVAGKGPLESMETIVSLYLYQSREDGTGKLCPLANLGSELYHSNDHIRTVAMEGYQRFTASFARMMGQMGIADNVSVSDAIVSTIVGAVTLSRLSVDEVISKNILDNAQTTVRTLLQATRMPLPA
ncbi:TetR/AcrR family transcriptional regulator [Rugamonas sp.]|uniref:TetR/AcrR family transcriptional regulator n=1 Tax=Rugamonas sp. TaxID=1926287 RepID=UPI0025D0272A|nr:TetR/AcrR family transcriptional regulator [Rugamonas sp.]